MAEYSAIKTVDFEITATDGEYRLFFKKHSWMNPNLFYL